jgi:hypothetical protein
MPLDCEEHGPAQEAFLCEHLLANPQQLWCSPAPNEESPWPDSWCVECDQHFQNYGEWNENNEKLVPIKLVCHHCYLRLRMSSTNR